MKQKKKWNLGAIFLVFVMVFTTVNPVERIRADSSVENDAIEAEAEMSTETQPDEEEDTEPDGEDGTQKPEKKPVLNGLVRKNGKTFFCCFKIC